MIYNLAKLWKSIATLKYVLCQLFAICWSVDGTLELFCIANIIFLSTASLILLTHTSSLQLLQGKWINQLSYMCIALDTFRAELSWRYFLFALFMFLSYCIFCIFWNFADCVCCRILTEEWQGRFWELFTQQTQIVREKSYFDRAWGDPW